MSLDRIKDFLEQNGIDYVEDGKNVMVGNIGISCPFCELDGNSDPSHHMGINEKGWFGCWRDSSHSGKRFAKLIVLLLDISRYEAEQLWDNEELQPFTEDFYEIDKQKNTYTQQIRNFESIELDKDFRLIENKEGIVQRFIHYLKDREIADKQIYNKSQPLYYSIKGDWNNRIIFPIYLNGRLTSWTSRSVYPNCELKYVDLSPEKSIRAVKHSIWNYDGLLKIKDQNVLYITEGIFDCLKLNSYLPSNSQATCIFTKTLRVEQMSLLSDIVNNFNKVEIMLDADASVEAENIKREMSLFKNVSITKLPDGVKDPADLPFEYIREVME